MSAVRARMKPIIAAVVALVGTLFATTAGAQTFLVSGSSGFPAINPSKAAQQLVEPIFREQVRQTTGAVHRRIVGALTGGRAAQGASLPQDGTGLAGGDEFAGKAVWGDITSTHLSSTNREVVVNGTGRQDGSSHTVNLGGDGRWGEFLVGGAIAMNIADLTLDNDGSNKSRGFTVTPYIGYTIDDIWSLDVQASYTRSDFDVVLDRRLTNSSRGRFDSDRFVVAANANAFKAFGKWQLTGTAGLFYAHEDVHEFTRRLPDGSFQRVNPDSLDLGQFKLGAEVVYAIDEWEPYAGATLEADFVNDGTDRVGAVYRGGFRYRFGEGTTAGLELSTVQHRSNEENYSIGANFRLTF